MISKCEQLVPKITALCGNTFGYSNEARRIMFDGTIGAICRYGATFFGHRLVFRQNRQRLDSLHRRIVLTCGRLYRTVSYLPGTAITNIPPLILTVSAAGEYRRRVKHWPEGEPNSITTAIGPEDPSQSLKARLAAAVTRKWQEMYTNSPKGSWTKELIPEVGRETPGIDFHVSQGLSGHGVFREYLFRMRRSPSELCDCGQPETAEHVLRHCPLYTTGRPETLDAKNEESLRYIRRTIRQMWEAEIRRQRGTNTTT